ncbi:hypothetical protein C0J52_23613 [Blattella germanica]|nr:hypothetical protein C0J52_23613 [Blattella germanica]
MNCQADLRSWLESVQNYASRAARSCLVWIPCLQRWRQVHPTTTSTCMGTKFIQLSSQRRIRVIHIESNRHKANSWYMSGIEEDFGNMGYKFDEFHVNNKRKSLSLLSNYSELSSEEYWFTRWNRPLKINDTCNCSFRKSWRNSLGDSQVLDNQPLHAHNLKQESDNPPLYEKCVIQKDNPQVASQIEPFVNKLLEEIWNDVFIYLAKTESQNPSIACDRGREQKKFNNDMFENDIIFPCHKVKYESNIVCKNLDEFNCETLIFCQESENCVEVKETMGNCSDRKLAGEFFTPQAENSTNLREQSEFWQGTERRSMTDRSCHSALDSPPLYLSVGCVNPSFLGSKTDPDLIEYVSACETLPNAEELPTDENFCSYNTGDTDSGFNTASLESTNNPVQDATDCSESSRSESGLVEPDKLHTLAGEIVLSKSQSDTAINDKTFETKDIMQSNQISLTSIDLRFSESVKSEESELMSKKSNTQHGRNKQCYHTKHIKRLKPLLYFLHGVGCSADLWSSLLQYFSEAGFEVLAPDMLGHGYSAAPDNPSAYTFHRLLKDAIDIFDRFVGDRRKCVVIGHAYGNIMYAPCGKHIESCPEMSKGMPQYVLKYVSQGQDWPEGDATFHRRILAPTLLVHGLKDPYVTLVQECEMERTIPRSFLELIPDAGHLSMLEAPRRLSHMIDCFIHWWSR